MTASSSASFSASVVVGDSPVVPLITRASLPWTSTRWAARRRASSRFNEPSAVNGVTMAVWTRPKGSAVMAASLSGGDHDQRVTVSNHVADPTTISLTVPATSASTGISIFMDSSTTTGSVGVDPLPGLDLDGQDVRDQLGDNHVTHGTQW